MWRTTLLLAVLSYFALPAAARADDNDILQALLPFEDRVNEAKRLGREADIRAALPRMEELVRQLGDSRKRLELLEWVGELAFEIWDMKRAESCYGAARKIAEHELGAEHSATARLSVSQACALNNLNRYPEAIKLSNGALQVMPQKDSPDLSFAYHVLSYAEMGLGKYDEAIEHAKLPIAVMERLEGANSTTAGIRMLNLIQAYHSAGDFANAISTAQRSVAILEKTSTPHLIDARRLLAHNLFHVGRRSEAEAAMRALLALIEKRSGPDSRGMGLVLSNLAQLYEEEGRLGEAEVMHRRVIAISKKLDLGEATNSQIGLANILSGSNRIAEARELIAEAQREIIGLFGKKHPEYASTLKALAHVERMDKNYDQATALLREAIDIYSKWDRGVESLFHATARMSLAGLLLNSKKPAEAEEQCLVAQQLVVSRLGKLHVEYANILQFRAEIALAQGKDEAALDLVDDALQIHESTRASPKSMLDAYFLRARIHRKEGNKSEALADLRKAINSAEEVRVRSAGAEHERADAFEESLEVFECMLTWQFEQGAAADLDECLTVIDRCRARSLIDELNCSGSDLFAARSPEEKKQFADRTSQLQSEIARLEKQLTPSLSQQEQETIAAKISATRDQLYALHREARTSSEVYRRLLSASTSTTHLRQFQRTLRDQKGLALVFFAGETHSYILCIDGSSAELHELKLDETQAQALGTKAGILHHEAIQKVMLGSAANKYRDGMLFKLQNRKEASGLYADLRVLWDVLVPAKYREKLLTNGYESWVVVPDGAICLCPFEALVTDNEGEVKFALDSCPPITYTPSINVFTTLRRNAAAMTKAASPAVLSVSRPQTSALTAMVASSRGSSLTAGERFRSAGGQLADLPHTELESNWLCQWLGKVGFAATKLTGPQATEDAVRKSIVGKQLIHFACHGLVDNRNGNFFGALALAKPADGSVGTSDGYLTLAEIYSLDLSQCELALLSACQTNAGPTQRAEGVWSLSRGFLGAGSKRVVANNWLVDDKASAVLLSYFAADVAKDWQKSEFSYGVCLRDAKRSLRKQSEFEHPYFWAPLVLIGAN
ncbi:CHAT domain-containing protein [Anatilimnocola floriformis]|uniref:CHAT domain-containing protein n=1 Tax=Anatilimnocola floriformis TaxID=2948575 RepID=UPI0020C4FE57|nr:CHAT domain-containing protein [Anatilimnocola floriformis]